MDDTNVNDANVNRRAKKIQNPPVPPVQDRGSSIQGKALAPPGHRLSRQPSLFENPALPPGAMVAGALSMAR
ncbi:hypothetical protein OAG51_00665 [Pirellulaceae bacterium]|nr:hypothetical protein [Pirellulaceae bacterium]